MEEVIVLIRRCANGFNASSNKVRKGSWIARLHEQARRGPSILLYEDETILGRFALPRAGWWRTANRSRLATGSLSRTQIKH